MERTVDLTPHYTDEILRLIHMDKEMVTAAEIAPVVCMHQSVIIKEAKEGRWDRGICNYVVSGRCVKFFRIDFLRKGGWI